MIVSLDAADPESVPVRDAATVMLVRDGSDGIEVFMLRRNLRSDFVGGAFVFPGGGVDANDGHEDLEQWCTGRTEEAASAILGLERGGLSFWVAAVRESFEEAGLLLAVTPDGRAVRFDDPVTVDRFAGHRTAVDRGERTLLDVCRAEDIRLSVDGMHYFSRWITPLGAPRRYDTRFFIAHPPEGQIPAHDDREVIANLWIRPVDALERHAAGEFELIFPTVRSLESLATFVSADDAVRHASVVSRIEPILPTLVDGPHGLRILLPGDEQYDAVTSRRVEDR